MTSSRSAQLAWLLCVPLWVCAAEAPPRPERRITLSEVVRLALERNLRLAAEKLNPQQADTVIIEQFAVFEPTSYGDAAYSLLKERPTATGSGDKQRNASGTTGIRKLFPLGTTVDLHADAERNWNNFTSTTMNPVHREELGLRLTQPLLRGFGVRVNTAGIAIARNERRIASAKLRGVALEAAAATVKGYLDLVFAVRNRELVGRSLQRAGDFLRDIQARVDAGTLAPSPGPAQAQAEIATRQEEAVTADEAIRTAEDALKVLTDLATDPEIWHQAFIPQDDPPAEVPAQDPERAVDTAFARRPECQVAQLTIDSQDIAIMVRRNELLPKVELKASAGVVGTDDAWSGSDRDFRSGDHGNWSLGVSFEYPLGNSGAKARHRRAFLARQQGELDSRALHLQIQFEVRNAVRELGANAQRLRAADISVKAEQERLRAEEILFKEVGRSERGGRGATSQDVLDAQAALARAEGRRLKALIDLNKAAAEVERVKATLLDVYNVVFEED